MSKGPYEPGFPPTKTRRAPIYQPHKHTLSTLEKRALGLIGEHVRRDTTREEREAMRADARLQKRNHGTR